MPRQCRLCTFLVLLLVTSLGCPSHHRRMNDRVQWLLEGHQHRQALAYLERYLGRHPDSYDAWTHRIHIRMLLDQRAAAAAEYWRMRTALGAEHPDVLEQIVLGSNGDWIVADYTALARCASDDVAGLAFFEAVLDGFSASEAAPVFVAPRRETVIGVMNALPGRFGAASLPLIERVFDEPTPEVRLSAARAAIRLSSLEPHATRPLLQRAVADPSPAVRRAVLESLLAPGASDDLAFLQPMQGESDPAVAVAWLALAERMAPERAIELKTAAAAAAPVADALAGIATQEDAPPLPDEPLLRLAAGVRDGSCDAECWDAAPFPVRRTLIGLLAPVLPLNDGVLPQVLSDPDMVVRTEASRYLALGATDPRWLALLQDPEQGVRLAAARSLVESGDPMGLEPLATMLADAGMEEKLSVLDAMLYLPSNPFLPLAIEAAKDEAGLVREAAIEPIAASCGEGVEAFMVERLTDEDPHVVVRGAAALYLTIGGKEEQAEEQGDVESAVESEAEVGEESGEGCRSGQGARSDTSVGDGPDNQ